MIEQLDVIKTADHIIDLGPEGGARGGRVVARGTPEQVARESKSYTGQFLQPLLERGGNVKRQLNGSVLRLQRRAVERRSNVSALLARGG